MEFFREPTHQKGKHFVVAQFRVPKDYIEHFVSKLSTVSLKQESYEHYEDLSICYNV